MPSFFLVAADDPIGKATSGDIVLTSVTPVTNAQLVEILSEQNVPLKSSAILIESVISYSISYELKSSSLTLDLDNAMNGYRLAALTVNGTSRSFPVVNVTVVKPTHGSFGTVAATYGTITIAGGFGVVNKWGATCSQPSSSSLSISSQPTIITDGNPGATLGQVLTAGYVLSAFRATGSLEGYAAVTEPSGAKVTADEGPIKTRDGALMYRKNWTQYLINA